MGGLTLGQLAKATRVGVETVRYCERRGLLERPIRRKSGYREFPPEAVRRIRFISRAQGLGFSFRQISQLLALPDGQEVGCEDVKQFALEKVGEIETKVAPFTRLRQTLVDLIVKCQSGASIADCPVIESLTEDLKEKAK